MYSAAFCCILGFRQSKSAVFGFEVSLLRFRQSKRIQFFGVPCRGDGGMNQTSKRRVEDRKRAGARSQPETVARLLAPEQQI
jgi:hypothetical protein